jgi:threonine/homoserine/homoserine lactone efflux protein
MTVGIFAIITTVVVAHFLALVSPGPDFLLIVKSAVRNTKGQALGVAVGIALANGIYITLCIVGVGSLLATSLVVMTVLKILGGLFLLYVAYHALRSKKADYAFVSAETTDPTVGQKSFGREFATGFLSGISNPKNIIFYLSLFSVVLTNDVGLGFKVGLGVWMTTVVFLWDGFIIFVLSQKRVKRVFGRVAFYVDKVAGTILGLIGLKLVETAIFEDRKG